MRFFKAFNLLHRRTKSETFIPGFLAPANGLGPNEFGQSKAFSSMFDFATSKYTSAPPTFSHLRGAHHATSARASVTMGHRRSTGRDSQSSMPSLMVEENMRLREALDLWFQEYSKVDELLQKCRAELAFERERVRSLQQEAVNDQEVIIKLREDLACCERGLDRSSDKRLSPVNFCGYSSYDRGYGSTGSVSSNALLLPAPSESWSSLRIPGKLRTLGDYTSALRLTLNTRRQLRDQKKISKFWKTRAVSTGEDIITPSTSAISSVYDPLPPGRRAAVEAFMQQRGLPLPQTKVVAQVERAPGPVPSPAPASGELGIVSHMDTGPNVTQILFPTSSKSSGLCVIHSSASIAPLPSASSKSSGVSRIYPVASVAQTLSSAPSSVSRLAPLASESLKAEINLFFGIQLGDAVGRLSSPSKKRRPGSAALSAACSSSTMGASSSRVSNILRTDNLDISFGSHEDLNLLVSSLFFHDFPPQVKLPTQAVTDNVTNLPMQPTTSEIDRISQQLSLPSIPSGSSGEALAVLNVQKIANDTDEMPGVLHSLDAINQTKMTRPTGRSWQKYLAPSPNIGKQKAITAKKVATGKENTFTPLSLFRKRSFL